MCIRDSLNPQMWSELMIDDADALAFEIDHLIEALGAYSLYLIHI